MRRTCRDGENEEGHESDGARNETHFRKDKIKVDLVVLTLATSPMENSTQGRLVERSHDWVLVILVAFKLARVLMAPFDFPLSLPVSQPLLTVTYRARFSRLPPMRVIDHSLQLRMACG